MQHMRKISGSAEDIDFVASTYGFNDQSETEDEPISIQPGLSMPAWKTPSATHVPPSGAQKEQPIRPNIIDSVSTDSDVISAEFPEFGLIEESERDYTAADARAAIRKERPVRISVWKRFTAWVENFFPSFADEAFLSRFNMYLGVLALALVVIIFLVVFIIRPF